MEIKNLTDLAPATLAALARAGKDAAAASRDALTPGEHVVAETITIAFDATVKVGQDGEAEVVAKAKPWTIVGLLLNEVNTLREAAGLAGIDLAALVEMAEKADKGVAKKAEKAANEAIRALKAPTLSPRKGQVRVAGTAETV